MGLFSSNPLPNPHPTPVALLITIHGIKSSLQIFAKYSFDSYADWPYPIAIRPSWGQIVQNSKNPFTAPNQRLVRCPLVLEKKIMDEIVLLNPSTGNYYTLNSTGSAIWNYCAEKRYHGEILDFVGREFQAEEEPTFQEDVDAYLKELLQEGILEVIPDCLP